VKKHGVVMARHFYMNIHKVQKPIEGRQNLSRFSLLGNYIFQFVAYLHDGRHLFLNLPFLLHFIEQKKVHFGNSMYTFVRLFNLLVQMHPSSFSSTYGFKYSNFFFKRASKSDKGAAFLSPCFLQCFSGCERLPAGAHL